MLKQNGMIEGDVSGGETFPEETQNKGGEGEENKVKRESFGCTN